MGLEAGEVNPLPAPPSAPAPPLIADDRALDMIWSVLISRQAGNLLMPNELSTVCQILTQNGRAVT